MAAVVRLHAIWVLVAAAAVTATVASLPAAAQGAAHDHGKPASVAASAPSGSTMADGEIRRIDSGGAQLTLRHGEIANLQMPPMTMVFTVRDRQLLDGLKVGDRIRFQAIQAGSDLQITRIEPQR